jgi:hypothetical protein
MQNLQKAVKLAHEIFNENPTISYKKNQFHFSCGKDKFNGDNLEAVEKHIMKRLYNHWLTSEFKESKSVRIRIETPRQYIKRSMESRNTAILKTRHEWSKGKAGDPRRASARHGNRKTKRFTKTQVLSFMRQKNNGRFASEKITREQYYQEFMLQNKNAQQRRAWRAKNGKKKAYSNKILIVRGK